MPRRKPKNPPITVPPPRTGKPGRPIGSKEFISEKVREAFSQLLEGASPHLQEWLIATAKKHPDKALDIFTRISERFVPSLARTEITGKDGEALVPIQINMPQIHLPGSVPGQMIGGGAPQTLLTTAEEVPKITGELPASEPLLETGGGAPAESPQELSEPPVEAPQQEFAFLPDLGKVSAPPGWTRD